jgi:hypothetical protein
MEGWTAFVVQVAMGIGLAACAGLRAFLPLLVLGSAGRMGWVPLSTTFEWLASTPALVVFAVAVVVEFLADKIPVVDHALDLLGGILKPMAGTVAAASVLTDLGPLESTVAGLLVGGGSAGLVHLTKAKIRLFSSFTTGGLGNPILSVGEDVASFLGAVIAVVLPVLALVLIGASFLAMALAWQRFRVRAERLRR